MEKSDLAWTSIPSIFGAAAAWQTYETRRQVSESKNQGEMARKQFLQACYDDACPVLLSHVPNELGFFH